MTVLDTQGATELAREALAAYGMPDASLRLIKHRENFVFAVGSIAPAEHPFGVLRIHRSGYHSDTELACEFEFLHALRSEGVTVPATIPLPGGESFCVVGEGHPAGPHQVDLQRFIPNGGVFGTSRAGVDGSASIDPTDFAEMGRLVAEVHEATERSGYAPRAVRQSWDLDGLVGVAPLWGDPLRLPELGDAGRVAVAAAMAAIRDTLESYGAAPGRFGPIHGDLTPENVLRTDDGFALIDFDDFATGWHLFDLATVLFFFTPHPRYAEYRRALFAGYESVRPLGSEDRAAFDALLVARALTYLGWAADRRGEPTAGWLAGTVMPHVVQLAQAFVRGRATEAAPEFPTPSPREAVQ